jgi:diguanylate cyclase (GGDEF)-like protein/PAS domain S-box-containing protein
MDDFSPQRLDLGLRRLLADWGWLAVLRVGLGLAVLAHAFVLDGADAIGTAVLGIAVIGSALAQLFTPARRSRTVARTLALLDAAAVLAVTAWGGRDRADASLALLLGVVQAEAGVVFGLPWALAAWAGIQAASLVVLLFGEAPTNEPLEIAVRLASGLLLTLGGALLSTGISGERRERAEERETELDRARDAERRYRALVEQTPSVTYLDAVDRTSTALYMSPQVEPMLGYPPEAWTSDPQLWIRLLHPEDRQDVLAEHERTNATGAPFDMEYRMVARDGRTVWVHDRARLVVAEDGSARYWQGVVTDVTDRREGEQALRSTNALLNGVIEGSSDAIFVKNTAGRYILINRAGAEVLGRPVEEIVGRTAAEVFEPDAAEAIMAADLAVLASGRPSSSEITTSTGPEARTFLTVRSPFLDEDGRIIGVIGVASDITERSLDDASRRRQNEYLTALQETALAALRRLDETEMLETILTRAVGLVETNNGYAYLLDEDRQHLEVKAGIGVFTDWMGYRMQTGEGMAGRIVDTGQPMTIEDYDVWPGRSATFPRGIFHAVVGVPLHSGGEVVGVLGLGHVESGRTFSEKDVELLTRFADIASVALDNARLHESAERELAQRKEAEQQLKSLAYSDRLTGLPNRAAFEEALQRDLARASRQDQAVAVLYLDLDNFKLVNDSLGHAGGDELLREMASRLRWGVRQTDLVARQGGDEFLVLLADLDRRPGPDTRPRAVRLAETVASRIHDALKWPFVLSGTEFYVSVSIGVSIYPIDAGDAKSLLREADAAMYRSKNASPGGTAMAGFARTDPLRTLSFATRLRKAAQHQTWRLVYQPVIDLTDGAVVGVEALLRWVEDEGEVAGPADFLPLAEEMGLIETIGDWVLDEVAMQCAAWRSSGVDLQVSFNVSPRQLWHPDLAPRIAGRLSASQVDPERVLVEVTESAAMTDAAHTQRILWDLHERGLRLAIDDFGTGFSSLSRLKGLPIDVLKIDRPFLQDVPDDLDATSVLRAVIDLARSLDMTPLAEGVENEAQREFLVSAGCSLAQGFHLGRPAPPEDIPAIVRGGASTKPLAAPPS